MNNTELYKLKSLMSSLTVFRGLRNDKVMSALDSYLNCAIDKEKDGHEKLSCYCDYVNALYEANGGNLTEYIDEICGDSENVYVKAIGQSKKPAEHLSNAVKSELQILDRLAHLTPTDLTEIMEWNGYLPEFVTSEKSIVSSYTHRIENIGRYGYGKYAKHSMFYIDERGDIIPVEHPDPIELDSLVEYRLEREKVLENTLALLDGRPAANILLTGDAGTGKSSTVKAICNRLYSEGLRLIEVRRTQLTVIPRILDELASNPLKFILFIDDLSFLKDDDNFNVFKAVLEGSVSTKSANVAIYATSNRRHIIKESFSDREGDDIHRNDTMQELISLSARFGMHITFSKPDKATYLRITKAIASDRGLIMDEPELELLAERFALERGGRSPRYAKQLVDELMAKQMKNS